MHDWTQLLNHANEVALKETWQPPPDELFQRILLQINQSKRGMFQDKHNECKDPACPLQTRSAFIHVLKRVDRKQFLSLDKDTEHRVTATALLLDLVVAPLKCLRCLVLNLRTLGFAGRFASRAARTS